MPGDPAPKILQADKPAITEEKAHLNESTALSVKPQDKAEQPESLGRLLEEKLPEVKPKEAANVCLPFAADSSSKLEWLFCARLISWPRLLRLMSHFCCLKTHYPLVPCWH